MAHLMKRMARWLNADLDGAMRRARKRFLRSETARVTAPGEASVWSAGRGHCLAPRAEGEPVVSLRQL